MPVDPLIFLGLWLLICVGAFLVGLRFYRAAEPRGDITVEQSQRFGRLMMMASTAMLLFAGAAYFHGDLKNVRTAWGG